MEKKKSEAPKNPYHKEFGLFNNIKYILSGMWKNSKLLIWMLPMGFLIYTAQRYLWTFITKFIIDLITKQGELKELVILVGVFSILMLILFMGQTFYYNKQWVQCIVVRMKLMMNKNTLMMTMPFELTEDPEILDCCQKAENACNSNEQGVEGMIHEIIRFVEQLGVVVFGLAILGTMNIWIVLGMTALAIVNFIISNRTSKYTKAHIWDPLALWWRKRWYMNYALADFSFAKDIRMYGLRSWLTNKFIELNKERYEAQRKNNKIWFWRGVLNELLWLLSQGAVYAYLIYRVVNHTLTIGNFTLYLTSAVTFFECISSLLGTVNRMLEKSRQVDDFRSFILVSEDIYKYYGVGRKKIEGAPQLPDFKKYEFTFENVSFKYPRADKYALKNLNITVRAGERLAVVGLNGAGKSTFIKLLLRLYEPIEGRILLNGNDILQYDKDSYYKIFAPVFQDVNIFAFSLAENVSMKNTDETDRTEVEKCVEASGLDEKSKRLEKGIDTQLLKIIYDDGVDLSGGQRQKLALSRALYKNSPVVVLDEPTAALDALAESKLYQDFDKLIGGKTSIYISHRLSSTQFCNNIAMFKDGQMVEYGTHKGLLEKGGAYAEMFKIQSQYYLEDDNQNSEGDSYEK